MQQTIADRVLDEEERDRRHLVVALSGAHAYGFPSPDSDLDLKAIHIEATERLLGLTPPRAHANRLETIDGVEIDYTSNELAPVLVGILQGNGNYLERVLGRLVMRASPLVEELRPLAARALSRRVHRHYHGFASGQLRALTDAERPTAKQVLYVLRTTLTGAHLLRSRTLETDLTLLRDEHGFREAQALVEAKRAGERTVLDDDARRRWLAEIARAFHELDDARASSPLPEEPPNRGELEAWLLSVRRSS
jgi:predicted nucleotidyltransferase